MRRIQGWIEDDLFDWVEEKIKEGIFSSKSHAVVYALKHIRRNFKKEESSGVPAHGK